MVTVRTSPSGPALDADSFRLLKKRVFSESTSITALTAGTVIVLAVITASGASGGGGRRQASTAAIGGTAGGGGARQFLWLPASLLTSLGFPAIPIDIVVGPAVTTVGIGGSTAVGTPGTSGNPSSISIGPTTLTCVYGGGAGFNPGTNNASGGSGGGWLGPGLNGANSASVSGGAPTRPNGQGAGFGGAPSLVTTTSTLNSTVYGGGSGGGANGNTALGLGVPGVNSPFGAGGGGAGGCATTTAEFSGGASGSSGQRLDGTLIGSGSPGGAPRTNGAPGASRIGNLLRAGDGGSGGGSSNIVGTNAGNGGDGGIPGGGGGGGGALCIPNGSVAKAGNGGQGARGELIWCEFG